MQSPQEILKNVTDTILFKPGHYSEIFNGLHQLHELYSACNGISAHSIADQDLWLPSGNAVSPTKAAHCLLEFQRTAVFVRGIYKALLQLRKAFPGEKLHILYAGCGPYATLLTPLTTMFSSAEVSFHLMDVNQVSLDAARRLYEQLQLTGYIAESLCADATTYRLPNDKMIHLVVCEAMLNALRKEPQVDIMLNLVPQLHPRAFFIPHTITVSAQLLDRGKESNRYLNPDIEPERINLGNLYQIGREQCREHEKIVLQIPEQLGTHNSLNLLTHINTFEDEKLNIYDSSLNLPLRIGEMNGYEGRQIAFTYQRGEKPGFVYEWQ